MRPLFHLLALVAVIMLLAACGGAAATTPAEEVPTPTPTSDNPTGAGQTAFGIGRELEGVDITIDECAWTQPDGGGDPELNVAFTLDNASGELLFVTYRLQNSSGTIYKQAGAAGDLTVTDKESGSRTMSTDKFDVGSTDIDLIVSIERFQDRTHETIPLGECSGP